MNTLVSTSRLKDFELMLNQIGNYILSSSNEPPSGTLDVSTASSVSKEEYNSLYEKIGGEDDPNDPTKFMLPVLAPLSSGQKYYLIGKVIYTNTFLTNNTVSSTFGSEDLDVDGYYTFIHGISHTNPLIQVKDIEGGQVLITKSYSNVGTTRFTVGKPNGIYTVTAVG